ncbi:MAG: hypothetical protein WAM97_14600 [Acidimicrobiales bacterium]
MRFDAGCVIAPDQLDYFHHGIRSNDAVVSAGYVGSADDRSRDDLVGSHVDDNFDDSD